MCNIICICKKSSKTNDLWLIYWLRKSRHPVYGQQQQEQQQQNKTNPRY